MKRKRVWLIGFVVVLVLIVGSLLLKDYLFPYYKIASRVSDVKEKATETSGNVLGWIRVQGTNIDYPIVDIATKNQSGEAYDYAWMNHPVNKLEKHIEVLGHNIQNVSSYPMIANPNHVRFEQLLGFVYTDFAKENQYIQLTIGNEDYLYRIYSVAFVRSENDESVLEDEKVNDYIQQAQKDSYFDFGVDVNENDKFITLITCTRFFGPTTEYEFKVEGRLVRKFEKITKNTITERETYQEIKQVLKEGETNAEI